ncbi:MAG: polysaccharide biosynthesis C-terminal domain-containing protein [Methanosarcina sp.]
MYPVHKNETGSFQELARTNDVKFGQLSHLVISPSCWRGNHYHTRKEEWFCCLGGKCELKLINVNTKVSRSIVLDDSNREFVKVDPFENHIITNTDSEKDCELLIIISEEYDEEDPDTFKPQDL